MIQHMGHSPAVLKGFLALTEAVTNTSIPQQLREQIALTVSQTNQSNYCLSAHTMISRMAGMLDKDIMFTRKAQANDPKTQAILDFAKNVVEKRGQVSDQEINKLKSAGISETEIVEIIMIIVMNMFTNYFNRIVDPAIDFPAAPKLN